MKVDYFRIFNEVCKYMNMTQAAKALFVSQPYISRVISEMEEQYGVQLFDRIDKKLYLTEAGQTFYSHSIYMIETLDAIEHEMRHITSGNLIKVGANITVATSLLSDLITSFKKLHPEVQFEVNAENTRSIQDLLLANKIDIALIEGYINHKSLVFEPFAEANIVVVYSKNHPFYQKEEITREDLENADYIVREPGSGTRIRFEEVMNSMCISWKPAWVCHNTQTIKNAVAAGHGVGVLSQLSVRKRLENGEFKAIPLKEMKQTFYLTWHREKFMHANLLAFKQHTINSFMNKG